MVCQPISSRQPKSPRSGVWLFRASSLASSAVSPGCGMKQLRFALAVMAFLALQRARADSIVVFNEIMYHPATNEPALEWLELYNQNAVDVDLSGWQLRGGISYTFPNGTAI